MSDLLRERIKERVDAIGENTFALSRAAGLSQSFLRDFLTGKSKSMRVDNLMAVADVLKTTPAYLLGDASTAETPSAKRDLPVYGAVAASEGDQLMFTGDVIDWVPTPPGLQGAREAYALYVTGPSMIPRFHPGEIVFIAPHRPVRHGDNVVIQQHTESGRTSAWLKEFVRNDDGDVVAWQHNPAGELRYARSSVSALHRVLTTNEVLGV